MKKTLVSILLILVLAISMLTLASCGSSGSEGIDTNKAEAAQVEEDGTYDSKEAVSEYLSIY